MGSFSRQHLLMTDLEASVFQGVKIVMPMMVESKSLVCLLLMCICIISPCELYSQKSDLSILSLRLCNSIFILASSSFISE